MPMWSAATDAARIMGAAFGFTSTGIMQHPEYMQAGLQLFQSGLSMIDVCQAALDSGAFQAMAGGLRSNDAFVDAVYRNITGHMPTDTEHAVYVGMLQGSGGGMTQAQLLMQAASLDANAQHIDLVGLQQMGPWFA